MRFLRRTVRHIASRLEPALELGLGLWYFRKQFREDVVTKLFVCHPFVVSGGVQHGDVHALRI